MKLDKYLSLSNLEANVDEFKSKMKNLDFGNLPKSITNNITHPIVNIYDSNWQPAIVLAEINLFWGNEGYSGTSIQPTGYSNTEIIPMYGVFNWVTNLKSTATTSSDYTPTNYTQPSKLVQIPDYLMPFVTYNLIVKPEYPLVNLDEGKLEYYCWSDFYIYYVDNSPICYNKWSTLIYPTVSPSGYNMRITLGANIPGGPWRRQLEPTMYESQEAQTYWIKEGHYTLGVSVESYGTAYPKYDINDSLTRITQLVSSGSQFWWQ